MKTSARDAEELSGPPVGFWSDAWRRLKRNRIALVAGGIIFLVFILAVVGPWLTPYTPFAQDIERQSREPSLSGFWFGTDEFGRSVSTAFGWAPGSHCTSPSSQPLWT